ncbi:MAG: glycosyltransferase family 39 protein [Endomicrobiales bacterium]|jgi:hypothetical protein
MKKAKKKLAAVISAPVTVPVMPWWVLAPMLLVWTVTVLQNYFNTFPLGSIAMLFTGQEQYIASAILQRVGESVVHIGKVLALCISAIGVGGVLTGHFLGTDEPLNGRLYFMYAIGMGVFAIVAFLLGLAGLLNPIIWEIIIAVFFLNGIYIFYKYGRQSFRLSLFSWWERAGLCAILCIVLLNMLGACCPELFYDSQYYQVGIPLKWVLDHKIATTEYMVPSFYPFNINMLFMIAHMMGNDITAKVVSFVCGITVCWGIYQFGKKFFTPEIGVLAALIFYSVPQVMIGSWKAAIELGITVFDFGAVFALIYFIEKKERFWLIISGVLCGLSMGSKYTGLVFCFVPSVMTLVAAGMWQRQGLKTVCRDIVLFSLVALAVSSPWYIRNIISSGNPIFPFLWEKIGFLKLKMTRSLLADPARPLFSFYNYFCFLWPMTMGTLQQETMIGPLFLIFIPLIFTLKKIDLKIKILSVYLLFSLVFWIVLGRFYLRFFIPTLPVISIIFAYYIASHTSKGLKNVSYLLIGGIVFANITYSVRVLQVMQSPLTYLLGTQSRKDYLSIQRMGYPDPYYSVIDYANNNSAPDATILFLGETRGLFSKRRFIISGVAERSPLEDWISQCANADQLYAIMQKNGVSHILLNAPEAMRLKGYDIFYWSGRDLRVLSEFWDKYVREVFHDIADVQIPQKGILSLKNDAPQQWRQFASSPYNYCYLYKIEPPSEAAKTPVPHDFFLDEPLYSSAQWEKMTSGADGQWLKKIKRNN